ncbi:MAG: adenine phosphoribosyltransferase [Ruminococcus sp.]|nr:adenine phosphoribosyltransferase [Ruminococcus sp.]
MTEFYEMQIAGLTRKLKKCPVNENLEIGAFIMFSDIEITVKSAEALLAKAPEFDVLLTAESKGIPLAYEMARQSGKNYVVARKSVKLYMQDVVSVAVKSITTEQEQVLYLDGEKADLLKNKKVLIIDDVISTGESLRALEYLVKKANGIVAGKTAVLAEGDASERNDIIFLEKLPLFFKNSDLNLSE